MKRILAFSLVVLTCVALASCGGNNKYEKYETVFKCLEHKDYDGAIGEIEKIKNGVYDHVDENGDPKTKTVEITSENWENYFELVQRDHVSKNQFDENADVYKKWLIVLKDGYTMADSGTEIAVEYNYTREWRYVTKNLTAGTLTVGELVPGQKPETETGAMVKILNEETHLINTRSYSESTEAIPVSVEIVRMKGTLCIYGE